MKRYAVLTLSGLCHDSAPPAGISPGERRIFRMDQFLITAEALASRKNLDKILVDCQGDFHPRVFSSLEVIRGELLRLKELGKEIIFYARSYRAVQLYLSSAASRRLINLCGDLAFPGLQRTFSFYKSLLEKKGLKAQVFRRGRYKSAQDSLRVKKLDPFNKEQWERLQEVLLEEIRRPLAETRGETEGAWEKLLSGRLLPARRALETPWVDALGTAAEVERDWKEKKFRKYKLPRKTKGYGRGPQVAVFHIEGALVDSVSRRDSPMGTVAGSQTVLKGLKKLEKDRRVKGVVIRINSPGGSAVASDEISRGIGFLAEKKPLVISLSDVAGSGGYWIAGGGRRLFVHPTTLTGSIGVLGLVCSWQGLLKEWGIHQEAVKTHPSADMGSPSRPLTAKEGKEMEGLIEATYREFIHRVAEDRKMEESRVEDLAQGRIWTGRDAVAIGLADEFGGIAEAVAYLKGELGWKNARITFHPLKKASFLQRQLAKIGGEASIAKVGGWPQVELLRLVREWNLKPLALMERGPFFSWDEELGSGL